MSGILVFTLRLLAAGALYAFVGWAFYTLWKDPKSAPPESEDIPILRITPTGADAGVRSFDQPIITIGRSDASAYQLNNDSISSMHARMSYHHQQWWLEDFASTNGTLLNDQPITAPTVLIDGDLVQCGSVVLQIRITR